MLDKFRDLPFGTKLTIIFVTVIAMIGILIGLGLGLRTLTSGNQPVLPTPNPTATEYEQPTDTPTTQPSYSNTVSPEDVNNPNPDYPDSPNSDLSESELMAGYFIAEEFVMDFCNFNSSISYTEYKNRLNKYLAKDHTVPYLKEEVYNGTEYYRCEIQVGQPKDKIDNNRYAFTITSTTEIKYKKVKDVSKSVANHYVIMGKENGKWKVFSVSVS